MSKALSTVLGKSAYVFLDDILVYSANYDRHIRDIEKVLLNLREAGLKLKLEKCVFFQEEIEYLGHRISGNGISCIQNDSLKNANRPQNVKSLQRFLGLANYYRRFVPLFSNRAEALYRLLNKDVKFEWTEECENSFQFLKNCLVSKPLLAHPNFNKTFYLFCDASNSGVGAVLMQSENTTEKKLKPIAYFSKSLNATQRRYSVTKKEFFAIHLALQTPT